MKTAVLACPTIKDELTLADQRVQSGYDFFWMPTNLHSFPEKYRDQIQLELDKLDGYERVILGFGFCGNAVLGLKSHSFELILPRIDDCISMMIGSVKKRQELVGKHHSIFLTRGWLDGDRGAWAEYEHTVKRHGEDIADEVFDLIYNAYDWLAVIDTGAYEVNNILDKTKMLARAFKLDYVMLTGNVTYFELLLKGPWTEEYFVKMEPHSTLEAELFIL